MKEEIIGEKITRLLINNVSNELEDKKLEAFVNNNEIEPYKWLSLKMLIKNTYYKNLSSYIKEVIKELEKYQLED